MRRIDFILISILLLLYGCGGSHSYEIKCEIEGLNTQGVEVFSVTSRGLVKSDFHPVNGHLTIRGSSPDPIMLEVFTVAGRYLFSCIVADGDKLEVKLDPQKPGSLVIKGNKASQEYVGFLNENSRLFSRGGSREINAAISGYVRSHPESLSSALLILGHFDARGDELLADSLLRLVGEKAPGAHPLIDSYAAMISSRLQAYEFGKHISYIEFNLGGDSTVVFNPEHRSYSLLAFTSVSKGDSIRKRIKDLYSKLPRRRFSAFEVCPDGDSLSWAVSIARDSAKWAQAWVPGGVAGPSVRNLNVASLPYFILCDSVGEIVYRGRSITAVCDSVSSRNNAWL